MKNWKTKIIPGFWIESVIMVIFKHIPKFFDKNEFFDFSHEEDPGILPLDPGEPLSVNRMCQERCYISEALLAKAVLLKNASVLQNDCYCVK